MHGVRLKIFILKQLTSITFGRTIKVVIGREKLLINFSTSSKLVGWLHTRWVKFSCFFSWLPRLLIHQELVKILFFPILSIACYSRVALGSRVFAALLAHETLLTIAGVAAATAASNRYGSHYWGLGAKFLKTLFQTLSFFKGLNANSDFFKGKIMFFIMFRNNSYFLPTLGAVMFFFVQILWFWFWFFSYWVCRSL